MYPLHCCRKVLTAPVTPVFVYPKPNEMCLKAQSYTMTGREAGLVLSSEPHTVWFLPLSTWKHAVPQLLCLEQRLK